MKQLPKAVLSLALLLFTNNSAVADSGAEHKSKQSLPIKMGTSGGSVNDKSKAFCCGGTLGALVSYDGALSILSNNHVVARSGSASAGEDIVQPALIDSSCRANGNIVADYLGNRVPLGTANVDAALATVRPGMVDTTGAILDIGVPCRETQTATIGLPVMKSGRTTGFTVGTVQAVDLTVQIQYQKGCNSGKKFAVTFTNQIATGNMSAGGDSGSVLYSNDGTPNPVGLLFAGSSSTTIHNPIQSVESAFEAGGHSFSFVGNSCGGDITTSASILGLSEQEVEKVRSVKARSERALFNNSSVLGVGVGASQSDANKAAIVVYLNAGNSTHSAQGIPKRIEGEEVIVIYTDTIRAL